MWLIPAAGGEPRRLTDTAGPVSLPVFSPDGQTIAFLGHRYRHDAGRNMRVFTVPVAGDAHLSHLRPGPHVFALFYQHGTAVVSRRCLDHVCRRGSRTCPSTASGPGGTVLERIITGERQVTGLSRSQDGSQCAFTATDPVSPPEVFLCHADGTGEKQLTDLNREWKAEVALARPERWRYERAGFPRLLGHAAIRL